MSGPSGTLAGWLRFAAFGLGLHGLALAAGFMEAKDLAKMGLWWLTAGSAVWLLCRRLGPQAAGRAEVGLALLFSLDIGTQGVVRGYFGASPQPGVIAESLANTTASEAAGFLQEQALAIGKGLALAALATLAALAARPRARPAGLFRPDRPGRAGQAALAAALLLAALLHFNPAMLRQQPLLRWGVVYARHLKAEREIRSLDTARAELLSHRADWQVKRLDSAPRTVVLVLGESATRLNWGALGYARDTTEPLTRALATLPGRAVLFRQAWSAEAFTLPSLRLALTPATLQTAEDWLHTPGVTQLAQAAGYRVSWLSNQPAHEGWFAAMARTADQQRFINKGNWRDSSATDHDLLAPLAELLAGEAPAQEFIVLHLLGQHFHYRQRCPREMHRWVGVDDDPVMNGMRQAGRSDGVRHARNEYDDAVRCGADVLGQVLQQLHARRPGRAVELLYFSDHGQEVGHQRDFAGHSEQGDAGHAIPMLWWSRGADGQAGRPLPTDLADRPFRLDWADHALQHLLRIESAWYRPEFDLLSAAYRPGEAVEPRGLARP